MPLETIAQLAAGKEFVVPLPSFWRRKDGGDPGNFQITVMCSRRTTVTVKWSGPNGAILDQAIVNGGNRLTVQPPRFPVQDLMQEYEDRKPFEVNQRSFYIETDQPVTVQAFYDQYFNGTQSRTEYYTIPPISTYGTSYTNVAFQGNAGGNSGFIIIASEDDTEVEFVPNVQWNFPSEEPDIPVTLTLKKYQVYQVLSNQLGSGIRSDMTGTPITSNKPIGVIAFSLASNSPDYEAPTPPAGGPQPPWPNSTSPLAEAVLPEADAGGTTFYTMPMAPQDSSYVRVGALEDGTDVSANGIQVIAGLNRGEYKTIPITAPTKFVASKPVQLRQVSRSSNHPFVDTVLTNRPNDLPDTTIRLLRGNPGMAMVPPVSYFKRTLQWTTPRPKNRSASRTDSTFIVMPWYHYALITAPVSTLNTVRLDGQPVDFDYTYSDGQYASAIVPLLPIQHIVEADEPISCIAYGFGWNDGYATISGEALRSIAKVDIDSLIITTCDTLADAEFLLSNLGNNNFRIDSINADGVQIMNIRSPIGFPTEMPPGRELPARITLLLPRPGTYTGTIRVFTDANNTEVVSVPYRIVRDSARMTIPAIVDYGAVDADRTSFDTLITLRNDGENPVTITTLSFDNGRFVVTQPSLPVTIPPGGSRSIGVKFTPVPGVPEEGRLRILGEPCFTPIDVAFTGFQGAGALLGVARNVTYDPYTCDAPESVDTTIIVTSIGDKPLEITAHQITGQDVDKFTLLNSIVGNTILPGQSDTLRVRYRPTLFGIHKATLELSTNAQNASNPVQIALNGRKDTAMALPKTRTVQFKTLLSCDAPEERTITLVNNGTLDAEITAIEGLDGTPFSVVESLPLSIPYLGFERTITVRFDPTADGDFETVLRIVGGPCGIAEEVTLKGSRVTPSLAVDREQIKLDTLYLCEGSTTAQFTLTNDGPVIDSISRVSVAGSGAFVLENIDFPLIMPPGESRTLTVTLTPDNGAANYAGAFEFIWGPCDGSTVVNLDAVVVDPDVTLSASDMDFGEVDFTTGPVRRTVTITNESTVTRTISSIDLGGSGNLSVVNPPLPYALGPGESVELEVEYAPQAIESLDVTASITVAGPCPETEELAITGKAVGQEIIRGDLTIVIPDNLQGNVNERITIPIQVRGGNNLAEVAAERLEVGISWRYTMLFPENLTTSIAGMNATILSSDIVGDRRVLRLSFNGGQIPEDGTLGSLGALVLLGDRMETDLRVDTVIIETPASPERLVSLGSDHGSFTVLGVCEIDGNRLVQIGTGLKISAPNPNPVRENATLVFNLEQEGLTDIALYDLLGNRRQQLVREELTDGSHAVRIDGSALEPGVYYCVLRSNGKRVQTTIIVQR